MKEKKKLSTSGKSAKDKMLERRKKLSEKGKGGGFIFPKEGTLRWRIKSPGPDDELGIEVIQFYLGSELGGIISPATFGEPCPFMEKYQELKSSGDDDDKALAKRIIPKRKYVIGGYGYKDEKGKEIDPEQVDKGVLVPSSVYQDIIDLYLDEDEWGDMTDEKGGYDIKIKRSGKGQFDTEYSVSACQKKPMDKKYRGYIDLESIVRKQIKSYDELEETLNKFLNISNDSDDEDEDDLPKKKVKAKMKSKSRDSIKKKKKYKDDLPF